MKYNTYHLTFFGNSSIEIDSSLYINLTVGTAFHIRQNNIEQFSLHPFEGCNTANLHCKPEHVLWYELHTGIKIAFCKEGLKDFFGVETNPDKIYYK